MGIRDCIVCEDDEIEVIIIRKREHNYPGDTSGEDITSRAVRLIRG